MPSNPFFELYVGDRISSEEFVTVFSPFLVKHAEALFVPGNVVVTGVQGSGKSMLLSLLKPGVRVQYTRAHENFPIAPRLRWFIGAGINLAHSNAIDFGYRRIPGEATEVALLFGDFVNYAICIDLIESVQTFWMEGPQFSKEVGVDFAREKQDALVRVLNKDDVWFGYLDGCEIFGEIVKRMEQRISTYRRYLHMNDKEFDPAIRSTKTAIGVPISRLVKAMKEVGVLQPNVNVFIHIDQYEELGNLNTGSSDDVDYRAVINRALAARDPHVSYRIGSRGYAWHNHGFILGTTAKLEEERDYKFVNLDEKLRRHENRKTWIFPGFAADVFARRLNHAGFSIPEDAGKSLLGRLFGGGVSPAEKARRYVGRNPQKAVRLDQTWPDSVKELLADLASTDPLSARLGEAWVLQKGFDGLTESGSKLPWEDESQQWWRKERIEVALAHIASRCQQRPLWCGENEIMELSGGNILTFLSICQFIWDALLQVGERRSERDALQKEVEPDIQAIGIMRASDHWLKKVAQETGRSGDRYRFIREVGELLSRELMQDRQMSNPGRNGFSVAEQELEQFPDLQSFLQELSDYGNLLQFPHTTKEKDRRSRQKWYLNPIFCPQLKLPFKRSKEPRYVRAAEVNSWLQQSHRRGAGSIKSALPPSDELPLFRNATG